MGWNSWTCICTWGCQRGHGPPHTAICPPYSTATLLFKLFLLESQGFWGASSTCPTNRENCRHKSTFRKKAALFWTVPCLLSICITSYLRESFCGLRSVKVREMAWGSLDRLFPDYLHVNNYIDSPLFSLFNVNMWEDLKVCSTDLQILVPGTLGELNKNGGASFSKNPKKKSTPLEKQWESQLKLSKSTLFRTL